VPVIPSINKGVCTPCVVRERIFQSISHQICWLGSDSRRRRNNRRLQVQFMTCSYLHTLLYVRAVVYSGGKVWETNVIYSKSLWALPPRIAKGAGEGDGDANCGRPSTMMIGMWAESKSSRSTIDDQAYVSCIPVLVATTGSFACSFSDASVRQ
jgi:hypothetical protein